MLLAPYWLIEINFNSYVLGILLFYTFYLHQRSTCAYTCPVFLCVCVCAVLKYSCSHPPRSSNCSAKPRKEGTVVTVVFVLGLEHDWLTLPVIIIKKKEKARASVKCKHISFARMFWGTDIIIPTLHTFLSSEPFNLRAKNHKEWNQINKLKRKPLVPPPLYASSSAVAWGQFL